MGSVSGEVKTGTIFGLLGPNGAGKDPVVRILTTVLRADSGKGLACRATTGPQGI